VETDSARDAGPEFQVSLAQLKSAIGRHPERNFFDIADDMLAELERPAAADLKASALSGAFG
jgi:hypothetical protein